MCVLGLVWAQMGDFGKRAAHICFRVLANEDPTLRGSMAKFGVSKSSLSVLRAPDARLPCCLGLGLLECMLWSASLLCIMGSGVLALVDLARV